MMSIDFLGLRFLVTHQAAAADWLLGLARREAVSPTLVCHGNCYNIYCYAQQQGLSEALFRRAEVLFEGIALKAATLIVRGAWLPAVNATDLPVIVDEVVPLLQRAGRFRTRTVFTGLVYAPLVMPEVITGLSLLLLFVALDLDRGFWTISIAHTTLTLGFVAVVVQARLLDFDTSLEEAAMDLGCPPLRTFLTVTLPLIWPAVASGWMLAFALSLDDLVIASFVTGPGATTLPIRIYSEVRLGVKPEINAVCTIMIAVVAAGLVVASLLTKRAQARNEQAAALGARL